MWWQGVREVFIAGCHDLRPGFHMPRRGGGTFLLNEQNDSWMCEDSWAERMRAQDLGWREGCSADELMELIISRFFLQEHF